MHRVTFQGERLFCLKPREQIKKKEAIHLQPTTHSKPHLLSNLIWTCCDTEFPVGVNFDRCGKETWNLLSHW